MLQLPSSAIISSGCVRREFNTLAYHDQVPQGERDRLAQVISRALLSASRLAAADNRLTRLYSSEHVPFPSQGCELLQSARERPWTHKSSIAYLSRHVVGGLTFMLCAEEPFSIKLQPVYVHDDVICCRFGCL